MTTAGRYGIAIGAAVAVVGALAWAVLATYYPVRPRLLCTMPLGTGQTAAYFGYYNEAEEPLTIPVGDDNEVSSWAKVERQPTVFAVGSSGGYPEAAFVVTWRPSDMPAGETLSWTLGPRTVSLTEETPRCPIPNAPPPPEDIVWVKPKPVEVAKVEPPKPPEPEVEAPKPPEPEPTPPKPEPTKPPKVAERRPPKPKQDKPVEPVKVDAPVALALTGLTNLDGGMAIQKGEFDSLGSAAVEATRETTAPRENVLENVVVGDPGGAPAREPKRVPARVKVRPKGEWPADAPPRAGAVLVRLSLLVGTDGKVKQVKVVRKAGPAFDREAKEVGMRAVFEPATVDGVAVESWVPWDVEFTPDSW